MYYSKVVEYWILFYLKNNETPIFKTDKAKSNWQTLDNLLNSLSEKDREFISSFYKSTHKHGTILTYSNAYNIPQHLLWRKINSFEKEYADKKGI